MKLTTFAKLICKFEGLKKQVNIAQVLEIMRVINLLTLGAFYTMIRRLSENHTITSSAKSSK